LLEKSESGKRKGHKSTGIAPRIHVTVPNPTKIYIDGKYLNQMIVAEGFAWWYKRYAPKAVDLKDAENDARASKTGLWSHPRPIPPWKFRRQKA
jgi:endonuclease YncB( thermonuclease family)